LRALAISDRLRAESLKEPSFGVDHGQPLI
jgi:hypothetical protein